MPDESTAARSLRDQQALLRDWQDRQRRRDAVEAARCGVCMFWRREAGAGTEPGRCHHTTSIVRVKGHDGTRPLPGKRAATDFCERYLPRPEYDPRPRF